MLIRLVSRKSVAPLNGLAAAEDNEENMDERNVRGQSCSITDTISSFCNYKQDNMRLCK